MTPRRHGTLLLQLERLGDLVQTLPALQALAAAGEPVTLVIREALAPWARALVPAGTDVRLVGDRSLAALIEALSAGPEEAQGAIALVREEIGPASPARLVNLTWHAAGAAVASAFGAPRSAGPLLSREGERLAAGFWGAYPVAAWDARPAGRVLLSDVRRLLVEEVCGHRLPEPELPRAARRSRGPVALVAGAGAAARRWPAEHQARLAAALHREGLPVALVGGPEDRALGEEIARRARELGADVQNLTGKLPPSDFVAWLREARLVVGPDTGPTHLAAASGVPCVMLLAASAHAWETGPAAEGAIALQALPVGRSSMEDLVPGLVERAARAALGEAPLPRGEAGVAVLQARAAGDPLGGAVLDGEDPPVRSPRLLLAAWGAVPGREPTPDALTAALREEADPSRAAAWNRAAALARRGALAADEAARLLARRRGAGAGTALREAGRSLDAFAALLGALPEGRLLSACLKVLLENLPPEAPGSVVSRVREIARRAAAVAASAAATPAVAAL